MTLNVIVKRYYKINDKKYFLNPDKDDSHLPMYKIWFVRDFIEQVLLYFASVFGCSFRKGNDI